MYNTVLLTVVTTLYIRALELRHLIWKSLYPLTYISSLKKIYEWLEAHEKSNSALVTREMQIKSVRGGGEEGIGIKKQNTEYVGQ